MAVFGKIKSGVQSLKEKTKRHHKWKMFAYAAIILFIMGYIWLFHTNTGWIARDSFIKTFSTDRERVITVYSADGEMIRRFDGTYNVEFFSDKYIVIMNQHTGERVNLYGASAVVMDESPDFDHDIELQ